MLPMSQVVLWDISVHIPHLQETQPNSKRASDNTDTFVSTHVDVCVGRWDGILMWKYSRL